ncbi:MAG TPA: PhzF family phenazine biosynthesis protein [Pyrinomonadaceae bacterium]|nr:PhzF family phenazine biosynthesis protein [Pyrinomonadaceae bacterium]
MGKKFTFRQVDVFTDVPFKGNPVAVVHDADSLAPDEMQAIARWTNLSETTFVCAPTDPRADYLLRIFTPTNELPFAGHPTVGSAHAVLRAGLRPKMPGTLVQQCAKGLIPVRVEGERLFFELPEPAVTDIPAEQLAAVTDALGISTREVASSALVDVGAVWLTLQLTSADVVRGLKPDQGRVAALTPRGAAGVTVFGRESAGSESLFEVRSFAPAHSINEDPVCGSGNGCVAVLVARERLTNEDSYVARQGRCVGRDGRVEVRFGEGKTIWVGGQAVTCVEGTLET